ncbi:MAG: hypothetical protein AAF423_07465 [Pseudomonadota bacterium]
MFHNVAGLQAAELKATNFRCLTPDTGDVRTGTINAKRDHKVCRINDYLHIDIDSASLVAWQSADANANKVDNLRMTVDGQEIPDEQAYIYGVSGDPSVKTLVFQFARNNDSQENLDAWKTVLTRTKLFEENLKSIGLSLNGSGNIMGEALVGVEIGSYWRTAFATVIFLAMVASLIGLAVKTGLLRDHGPAPSSGKRPFSLGKTQMAFWLVPVFGSFLYLWLVTGETDLITTGVLGLIGISGTTGVFATAITVSKANGSANKRATLLAEKNTLETEMTSLDQEITALGDDAANQPEKLKLETKKTAISTQLAKINTDMEALPASPAIRTSKGFFRDLLISGDDVSMSRFQMIAWTVSLGFVFVYSVYANLQMTDFSATLLGLIGLSSGTYVGFKFPTEDGK